MKKLTFFRIIFSAIFIIALAYLVSKIEFSRVAELFLKVNPLLLFLALFSFFVAIFLKVIRLRFIAEYYSYNISLKDSLIIQMVSISFATLTPGRIGEAVKAVLLNQKKFPFSESLGMTLFERLFDLLLLGFGAIIFSVLVINNRSMTIVLTIITLVFVAMLFMLKEAAFIVKLPLLRNLRITKYIAKLKFDWKLGLIPIVLLSILVWAFSAGLQWFTLAALNTNISFLLVFGVLCISTLASIISVLPDGIGVADLSIFFLYSLAGVPNEVTASLLIIYRLFGTILPLAFTFVLVQITGIDLNEIRKNIKEKYARMRNY